MNNTIALTSLLISITFLAGCVERRLTIATEPSDAIVYLNDEEIGRSPVTVDFNWYGVYQVQIIKPGFDILNDQRQLAAPAHDSFPWDFFAEVLWPGTITDEYNWKFTLEPAVNMPSEELLQKAEKMRKQMADEIQTAHKKQAAEELSVE